MDNGLTNGEVEDLYRRYGFYLRRRCSLVVRDAALTDDAIQEAFVRMMRSGAPVRHMEKPLRWLERVVDRCAIDQLRKGKRLRNADSMDSIEDSFGPHPNVSLELRNHVLLLLADLEEKDQEIAIMAFVDGMTQSEIALEIGYSRVTINKRVQSIRQRAERVIEGR